MFHTAKPIALFRWLVACLVLVLLTAPAFAGEAIAGEAVKIDAASAHERAEAGEVLLIDIRRPSEWRETGVATSAVAITMHDRGFLANLEAAVEGDKSRPIALICAQGVRSAFVARELPRFGYTNVIDVSEGMVGSRAGPGWIKRGLPVRQP